jgi:hypothetical protein
MVQLHILSPGIKCTMVAPSGRTSKGTSFGKLRANSTGESMLEDAEELSIRTHTSSLIMRGKNCVKAEPRPLLHPYEQTFNEALN